MRLVYSEHALTDLIRLRTFIAEKDPSAAMRIADDLIARLENLTHFPELGHLVERAPKPESLRDVVFDKYLVRYSPHAEAIIILRVWHQFEDREL